MNDINIDPELNQQDQSSFYGIITEDVLSSKNISAECKLLFVKLTMMTRSKGYAWPSNKFLAEYFDVTEREIQYRLQELKKFGYIVIQTKKIGMKTDRKIYINANSKNILNHEQTFTLGANKRSPY